MRPARGGGCCCSLESDGNKNHGDGKGTTFHRLSSILLEHHKKCKGEHGRTKANMKNQQTTQSTPRP